MSPNDDVATGDERFSDDVATENERFSDDVATENERSSDDVATENERSSDDVATEDPTHGDDEATGDREERSSDDGVTSDGDEFHGESRARSDEDAHGDDDVASPLADLAGRVADNETRQGTDDPLEDLFDREIVTEIDSDRLWERLENDESVEPPPDERERDVREIDAHRYCHKCEHFSKPPQVACTREGTEILEMPSLERFRVSDCPVVREDEQLERNY